MWAKCWSGMVASDHKNSQQANRRCSKRVTISHRGTSADFLPRRTKTPSGQCRPSTQANHRQAANDTCANCGPGRGGGRQWAGFFLVKDRLINGTKRRRGGRLLVYTHTHTHTLAHSHTLTHAGLPTENIKLWQSPAAKATSSRGDGIATRLHCGLVPLSAAKWARWRGGAQH